MALNACRYDEAAQPLEGQVVDMDEDVVELCNRVRARSMRDCAIVFIDEARRRLRRS